MTELRTRCVNWLEKLNNSEECVLYFDLDDSGDTSFILGDGDFRIQLNSLGKISVSTSSNDQVAVTSVEKAQESLVQHPNQSIEDILHFIYTTAVPLSREISLADSCAEDVNTATMVMMESDDEDDMTCRPTDKWIARNDLQHRLEQKEKETRQRRESLKVLSKSLQKCSKEKVFSATGSAKCLMNELFYFMDDAIELGYEVEAIDDDIYRWRVKMTRFDTDSDLYTDMTLMFDRFGYSYVEFQLAFAMDMFPFYPPMVTVVRPRFTGFMPGKLANLVELHPLHWDPIAGIQKILSRIRTEFECSGRIDMDAIGNDPASLVAAYLPIENVLLKLGLATETPSRASFYSTPSAGAVDSLPQDADSSRHTSVKRMKLEPTLGEGDSETTTDSAASKTTGNRKTYWAKGTGYGSSSLSSSQRWTAEQYVAIKEEKQRNEIDLGGQLVQLLLDDLLDESRGVHAGRLRQTAEVLGESCVVPLISNYLKTVTLLEMDASRSLYFNYWRILHIFASSTYYRRLLLPTGAFIDEQCIEQLATTMHKNLARFGGLHPSHPSTSSKCDPSVNHFLDPAAGFPEQDDDLEEYVVRVLVCIEEAAAAERSKMNLAQPTSESQLVQRERERQGSVSSMDLEQRYKQSMEPLQMDSVPELPGYHYRTELQSASSGSGPRARRLRKELADIATSLPLSLSSSVWLRVLDGRMDAVQTLISGPDDTPYSNGLFLFDTFFPDRYPSGPPLVNLQTTGRGSVRFNPNLYNCGKVCLSLLGTWRGEASEGWSELSSTFLQVLVSIQSLILVPEPYFNEPGHEVAMGTPAGTTSSRAYNETIRCATVRHAMIDHLVSPKQGFENVIRHHFSLKKDLILAQVQHWIEEASGRHTTDLRALKQTLEGHLAKL